MEEDFGGGGGGLRWRKWASGRKGASN